MSNYGFCELLGDLSGYRPKYLEAIDKLDACAKDKLWLVKELEKAQELVMQLKLLVPREPPPEITYIVERDTIWIQQQVDSMGLAMLRHPLDVTYRMTNHSNMLNVVAWDNTDAIQYIREQFDCENFALLFKARVDLFFHLGQVAVILDYISKHGYNLIFYPNENHMVCEPQSDGLYIWTKRVKDFYSMRGAICLI